MRSPLAPIAFPPLETADASGLLAVTPGLDVALLLSAYRQGIFPWTDAPVGWFAPPRRGLLLPERAHFPRNFARLMRKSGFCIGMDGAFGAVILGCREAHAADGEWLTPRFVAAYTELWTLGHAHSVEVWRGGRLVGGLYGVQVGGMFCAESMFTRANNAAKAALYALLSLRDELGVELVDVQVVNATTHELGASEVPRQTYMRALASCLRTDAARAGRPWPMQRRPITDYLPRPN